MDKCRRTGLVFQDVVASVEVRSTQHAQHAQHDAQQLYREMLFLQSTSRCSAWADPGARRARMSPGPRNRPRVPIAPALQVVNCSSVEVQCTTQVPLVAIDKCDGCQVRTCCAVPAVLRFYGTRSWRQCPVDTHLPCSLPPPLLGGCPWA